MGGSGSGRRYDSNETTTDYRALDIRKLARGGWLRPSASFTSKWTAWNGEQSTIGGRSEPDHVIVSYRHQYYGKPWESLEYPIRLEHTACYFGGTRPWFVCPGQGCGRRVAILYSGRLLLCRKCRSLAYLSQRETPLDRSLSRVQKALDRFPNSICLADGIPPKPKGMHWATYERLSKRFRRVEQIMLLKEIRHFGVNFEL
jgi:hypothetical protein